MKANTRIPLSFFYMYFGHGEMEMEAQTCQKAKTLCVDIKQYLIFGPDVNNYNTSRMAEVHLGGGSSVKCVAHYLQIFQSGQFQKY